MSSEQIEKQIFVLEKKLADMKQAGHKHIAVERLVNNLKVKLKQKRWEEYLTK